MTQSFTQSILLLFALTFTLLVTSCERPQPVDASEFTLKDEARLGTVITTTMSDNQGEFPILSEENYPDAYDYLNNLVVDLIASPHLTHRNVFNWQIKILTEPEAANAFVVPGGPVFITTGLLNQLHTGHQLAGIIAYEMAYVDLSISTELLEMEYGANALLDVALGANPELAIQLARKLAFRNYDENYVKDADNYGIRLLCPTNFSPSGLAEYLEMASNDPAGLPLWLTNSPGHPDRLQKLINAIDSLNCQGTIEDVEAFESFLEKLPG